MAVVVVSAKVSVFNSKCNKTFPKSSQQFYLAQTLIKHKKHNQNLGRYRFLLWSFIMHNQFIIISILLTELRQPIFKRIS